MSDSLSPVSLSCLFKSVSLSPVSVSISYLCKLDHLRTSVSLSLADSLYVCSVSVSLSSVVCQFISLPIVKPEKFLDATFFLDLL